jgi:hypothetical protein
VRGLDGGRFNFNGADNMPPIDILSKHPLLKGARTIDAFDETYVLKDLNPDIGLIQEVDNNGTIGPWSWMRTQGGGRVFSTASGHIPGNQSTNPYDITTKPAYYDLVLRGVQWTVQRYSSEVGMVSLTKQGKLVGRGIYLADDKALLWQDNLTAPEIFSMAGDVVSLNGVDYEFTVEAATCVIPCPGLDEAIVFHPSVLDGLDVAREGIRKRGSLLESKRLWWRDVCFL